MSQLALQAGAPLVVPVLSPDQTPLRWLEARQAQPNQTPATLFLLAGESLLLAQQLLDDKEELRRRQGLLLASESANFIAAHLSQEKTLLAHVYQGFILPNIALAHVQSWRDPSRQRLLESAISAFENAGETDTQKRVLEWLLQAGAKKTSSALRIDTNSLDWARGTLASLLMRPKNAPRADLKRALALLSSIQSPDMAGFKHLQTLLETRLQSAVASSARTTP